MNRLFTYLILLISISSFSQSDIIPTEIVIQNVVQRHFEYFTSGDIDNFMKIYSHNYVDLGGGANGDGKVDLNKLKSGMKKLATSEEFLEIKDKSFKELFDLENKIIYDYREIINVFGDKKKFTFELQNGDYYISLPSKIKVMGEGWFGYFRLIDGKWKIVAGD